MPKKHLIFESCVVFVQESINYIKLSQLLQSIPPTCRDFEASKGFQISSSSKQEIEKHHPYRSQPIAWLFASVLRFRNLKNDWLVVEVVEPTHLKNMRKSKLGKNLPQTFGMNTKKPFETTNQLDDYWIDPRNSHLHWLTMHTCHIIHISHRLDKATLCVSHRGWLRQISNGIFFCGRQQAAKAGGCFFFWKFDWRRFKPSCSLLSRKNGEDKMMLASLGGGFNQPVRKICWSKWVHLPQGSGWKF